MDPQIVNKISEEPDSKRSKLDDEEEKCEEMPSSSSDDSTDYDSDDVRMYDEEFKRHGAYDFDCSRVGRIVGYRPVIFEESDFADEPETDGELINRLSKTALDKYNTDKGNNLEFVKAVKSNWSIGGGHIFSITFEAKDASQSEPIPFHAQVPEFFRYYLARGSLRSDSSSRISSSLLLAMVVDSSVSLSPRRRQVLLRDQVQLIKRKDYGRYGIVPVEDPLSFEKGFYPAVIRACQSLARKNDGLTLVGLAGRSFWSPGKTIFTTSCYHKHGHSCSDGTRLCGRWKDPLLTGYDTLLDNKHGTSSPCSASPLSESPHLRADGSVDYKSKPAVRSSSGGWRSAGFIIGNPKSVVRDKNGSTATDEMVTTWRRKSSDSSSSRSSVKEDNATSVKSANSSPSSLSNYAREERKHAEKEDDRSDSSEREDDHVTALDDEEAVAVQEQVRQIKAQEEEFETLDLKIVQRKNRTGFEEEKNFHVVLNSVIAGRYHVTEYLGSAAFSKAIQAHDLQTGMDVCIKIIKNNKDFFDQSLDEIKLLKLVNKHDPADKFNHPLRLYDYFYYREDLLIVCELLKANLYEFHKFTREPGGEVHFTMPRLQALFQNDSLLINEISSSGGKKSAGGIWVSGSQGIAEDASDLVSGFATIGDGLSESVDYRNEYWDSDEYEDDDDIGYVRQPNEDETWSLTHEIDNPSDQHERDATKDEDDQSYAEEASYLSGEQYLQAEDAEPISSENDRRLTVSEIYPASKKKDLICQYDGQLMDEEVLNSMREEPAWQGFEQLYSESDKKHTDGSNEKASRNDDSGGFFHVKTQTDGGFSFGSSQKDRQLMHAESSKSLWSGTPKSVVRDKNASTATDEMFTTWRRKSSDSSSSQSSVKEDNATSVKSANSSPSSLSNYARGERKHAEKEDDRSDSSEREDDHVTALDDEEAVAVQEQVRQIKAQEEEYEDDDDIGYVRQPTEDEAWSLAHEIDNHSEKNLLSRGFLTSILLSFCKVVSAETMRNEPVCETQPVYATCYEQLMVYSAVIVGIAGCLLLIWKFCMAGDVNQVPAVKKKRRNTNKSKTKKKNDLEANGEVKQDFGDVFAKFLEKHNLQVKDDLDVQQEVLPWTSDEEEVLSPLIDEARVYEFRVYRGVYNQREVALKCYPATDLHFEIMANELAKTYKADYQANILHCYGIQQCEGSDVFCLLLQPWECSLDELVEYFKESKKKLSVEKQTFFDSFAYNKFWESATHSKPYHPTPLLISLLKGIIKGVSQLHSHGIVHRDLHPGNILITYEGKKTLTARIGGMSRSVYVSERELLTDSDEEELTSLKIDQANKRWHPPGVVTRKKILFRCENDMYSVGCILIYAISRTVPPDNKKAACDLVDFVPEAYHLVKGLMKNSHIKRFKAGKACGHPFFWKKDKKMRFFEIASNRVDSDTKADLQSVMTFSLSNTLKGKTNVTNWKLWLEPDLITHMNKQKANYQGWQFLDLVRLMRNTSQHLQELPPSLQIFSQTELWEHFDMKFPPLLIEVYKVVEKLVEGDNHEKAVKFGTFFEE
ncbi:unnamed protein product [Microthlaspi erraticum]|uniref:Protein kinase domain-containing protein n=1 Tax=Microthlaspi erraticum TaxID=1685480 RepID=A0A6D2KKR3_9BRAS|nr:unnamed protein product [Microthlaspi erraticum]